MAIRATADTGLIEAPITVKAYLMCAFAAFGGIFFGFDSGYINGVLDTAYAIHTYTGKAYPPTGNSAADLQAQAVRV
jgi:SP family sugar:H+ symporter-like MFS transporter